MNVKNLIDKESFNLDDLTEIMKILRSENGCPWDKEQTHESIRCDLIEECYEAVEAIDKQDDAALSEELGDVLFQVVFHSRISEEQNRFDISDVITGICKKLIHRHPHVFGSVTVHDQNEVMENWAEIKKKEKAQDTVKDELEAVAKSLPSLMRAEKIIKRARRAGVYSSDAVSSISDISKAVLSFQEKEEIRKAVIGEILFSVCSLAQSYDIDAEEALYEACDSFIESNS